MELETRKKQRNKQQSKF